MRGQSVRVMVVVSVLAASTATARTSHADDAPPAVDEQTMVEARKYFQAGVNLLDDPDGARYEDAYNAFQKAFSLSKSPKVLGNIGFCALKLERDGEAIDAYTTYLRDSRDVDPRERAQIERDLATLNSSVATFRFIVPKHNETLVAVDTRIQTRGSPVINSYSFNGPEFTIRLRAGRHAFKIKSSDQEARGFEVSIEPGSQSAHEFTFAPKESAPTIREAAPGPSPSYVGPVLLSVVGVAALGTGAVMGLMARSTTDSIASSCPNDVCPGSYDLDGNRREAKTLGTIADASFIGGGVALGGGLLWALLTPGRPKSTRVGWQSGCSGRGCSVAVGGSF